MGRLASGKLVATLQRLFGKYKAFLLPAFGVLALVVLIVVIGSFFAKSGSKKASPVEEVVVQETTQTPAVEGANTQAQDLDKTIRDKTEVFYDVKLTDETANPYEIATVGESVVLADRLSGKLFVSKIDAPKFSLLVDGLQSPKSLDAVDGKLRLIENQKYKLLDLEAKTFSGERDVTGAGAISNYLDFVYAIEGSKVVRYSSSSGVDWAQSADFVDAKSMAISVSIYFVTLDGRVVKYTRGEKDAFEFKGFQQKIETANKLVTNNDLDYLFILDAANRRIVKTDKDGVFIEQYKRSAGADWENLRDFAVSADGKAIFVLDGSTVYRIGL
jgi:hypothetical protein